jgi:hypothetical protein
MRIKGIKEPMKKYPREKNINASIAINDLLARRVGKSTKKGNTTLMENITRNYAQYVVKVLCTHQTYKCIWTPTHMLNVMRITNVTYATNFSRAKGAFAYTEERFTTLATFVKFQSVARFVVKSSPHIGVFQYTSEKFIASLLIFMSLMRFRKDAIYLKVLEQKIYCLKVVTPLLKIWSKMMHQRI